MKCFTFILSAISFAVGTATAEPILNNPGFETELSASDWFSVWGAKQFVRETDFNPPEGSYAIWFKGGWEIGSVDAGGGVNGVYSGIETGETYVLSGEFYRDDNWTASRVNLKLEFWKDGETDPLATYSINPLTGLNNDIWTTCTVTGAAPAGTTYLQVVLEAEGIGAYGAFGADNFQLNAVPEPVSAVLLGFGIGALYAIRRKTRCRDICHRVGIK